MCFWHLCPPQDELWSLLWKSVVSQVFKHVAQSTSVPSLSPKSLRRHSLIENTLPKSDSSSPVWAPLLFYAAFQSNVTVASSSTCHRLSLHVGAFCIQMRPRVANLHPFKEDVEMSIDPLTALNFQHWATGEQRGWKWGWKWGVSGETGEVEQLMLELRAK